MNRTDYRKLIDFKEDFMAEGGFDFKKFIDDSKNTLLKPKEYFSGMPKEGGMGEPVIKAVLYGAVAGLFTLIWSVLGLSALGGGMFGGMLGGGIGIMAFIGSIIFAIIGLFVGGVIVLIISAICGGTTDYEANVRVTASLMVLSPISSLFGFLSYVHYSLGAVVSLVIGLFGVWLLYNAVVNALQGKEGVAKVVSLILAAIPVLMLISTLMCTHAIQKGSEQFMKGIDPSGKQSQEMQKNMQNLFNKAMEEAKKQQ